MYQFYLARCINITFNSLLLLLLIIDSLIITYSYLITICNDCFSVSAWTDTVQYHTQTEYKQYPLCLAQVSSSMI